MSYKTAIKRSSISAPFRYLYEHLRINKNSHILDYGCGYGFDADFIGAKKYDPYYYSSRENLIPNKYDIVLCTYVLNVIHKSDEKSVLDTIDTMLKRGGIAYITVRRDIKVDGDTSRGYQRLVTLNAPYKLLKQTSSFSIYEYVKIT